MERFHHTDRNDTILVVCSAAIASGVATMPTASVMRISPVPSSQI
jgi:hypothetical protein